MRKQIIIVLALALITNYACTEKKLPELKGEYVIGGFKMQPNTNFDSLNKVLDFGKVPFNFLDNDTVILSSEVGNKFFGDSIFKYELTDKFLTLTNNNKKIELEYINDVLIFRINVNDKDFTRLDLVKPNKK